MVSSVVIPLRHELVDEIPHRDAAPRVEPRGRLVEEQHRRAADQAHRDVEPAAHATRVGAHHPVGRDREVEALEQLAGAARGSLVVLVEQPTDVLEVLVPGEALVDRGVLPGQPDAGAGAARVLHDVDAVDERRPASGLSSVVRIRTVVVLPAPFGPSTPSTVARSTARSTPRSASVAPNRFVSPMASTAGTADHPMTGAAERPRGFTECSELAAANRSNRADPASPSSGADAIGAAHEREAEAVDDARRRRARPRGWR